MIRPILACKNPYKTAEEFVANDVKRYIGCGVVLYLTVPSDDFSTVYENHKNFVASALEAQAGGNTAFEVQLGGFKFMIASK